MYTLFDYMDVNNFNSEKIQKMDCVSSNGRVNWNKFFLIMYKNYGDELLFPIDYSELNFSHFFGMFYENKYFGSGNKKKSFIKYCDAFNKKYSNILSNTTVETTEKNIDAVSKIKLNIPASHTKLKEKNPNSNIKIISNDSDSTQITSSDSLKKNEYVYPYTIDECKQKNEYQHYFLERILKGYFKQDIDENMTLKEKYLLVKELRKNIDLSTLYVDVEWTRITQLKDLKFLELYDEIDFVLADIDFFKADSLKIEILKFQFEKDYAHLYVDKLSHNKPAIPNFLR